MSRSPAGATAPAAVWFVSARTRTSLRAGVLGLLTVVLALGGRAPLLIVGVDAQVASAESQQLYEQHCTKCHRTDGTPKKIAKGAPKFTDPMWTATLEEIERSITNGKGEDMPKFRTKLTPAQIRALAGRVLAFRASAQR